MRPVPIQAPCTKHGLVWSCCCCTAGLVVSEIPSARTCLPQTSSTLETAAESFYLLPLVLLRTARETCKVPSLPLPAHFPRIPVVYLLQPPFPDWKGSGSIASQPSSFPPQFLKRRVSIFFNRAGHLFSNIPSRCDKIAGHSESRSSSRLHDYRVRPRFTNIHAPYASGLSSSEWLVTDDGDPPPRLGRYRLGRSHIESCATHRFQNSNWSND